MFIEGGARLKEERKRLRKNQEQMAELCGVAKSTYCNYEAGSRAPDALCLAGIFEAGADVMYILTGNKTEGRLTLEETTLIENYRAVSEERKCNLFDVAEALSQKQRCEKKAG